MKHFKYCLLVLILSLTISCGESQEEEVEERVRPALSGGTSAAYFIYQNSLNRADTLLAVESEAAGLVQVHQSYETEDGMMGMSEQKEVVIPPGEALKFKQGGLHIMLMRLNRDLVKGDTVQIVLEFSGAGTIHKKVPVRP